MPHSRFLHEKRTLMSCPPLLSWLHVVALLIGGALGGVAVMSLVQINRERPLEPPPAKEESEL
jgi:hypothetical protein